MCKAGILLAAAEKRKSESSGLIRGSLESERPARFVAWPRCTRREGHEIMIGFMVPFGAGSSGFSSVRRVQKFGAVSGALLPWLPTQAAFLLILVVRGLQPGLFMNLLLRPPIHSLWHALLPQLRSTYCRVRHRASSVRIARHSGVSSVSRRTLMNNPGQVAASERVRVCFHVLVFWRNPQ